MDKSVSWFHSGLMPFLGERKKEVSENQEEESAGKPAPSVMGLAGEACKAMPLSAAVVS